MQLRRDAVRHAIIPAKYRPTFAARAYSVSYAALASILALCLLLLHALTQGDGVSHAHVLHLLVAVLRQHRVAAKRALLGCGAVEMTLQLPSPVGPQSLRLLASGPADAPLRILLHAEDGETAAVWGFVHAALAQALPQCRVVSFHREGAVHAAGKSTPVSLRVRDVEAVMDHLDATSGAAPARAVLVCHGEGVWGALMAAGLSPTARYAGAVLVAPVLLHRGRHTAWWDAALCASRVTHESDPGIIQRLLAPPPVQHDARLLAAIDASTPRRADVLRFAKGVVGRSLDDEQRLAEDLRRQRARQSILSSSEAELLAAVAPASAMQVRVCTYGADALPRSIPFDQRTAVCMWWLMAANAVGLSLTPADARTPVEAARMDALPDMTSELSGGLLSPAARREDAADDRPRTPSGSVLNGVVTSAPDAIEASYMQHALRRIPFAIGLRQYTPPDATFSYLFLQRELRAFPASYATTLVHAPSVAAPAAYAEAVGDLSHRTVLSIPLQAPEAVVRDVLHVVENVHGGAAEHAAAVRRYEHFPDAVASKLVQ